MRRFNLRERWRARTYTPFVLVPYSWVLLIALYYVFGVNTLGFSASGDDAGGTIWHFSSDSNDPSGVIFNVAVIGGCVIAFMRRRTRRVGLRARGWVVKWRRLRMFDGRFHLFPFGHLKRLRLTSAAYGGYLGASCASFSVWPRWQMVRRFYDVDLVELPKTLPPLALFPERQYERVAAALGGKDILTESDAFNRRWRVVGRDPRYALAVLHPLMMEFLASADFDDMPISIEGGAIMTWHPGRSRMETLGKRLTLLHGVAALVPKNAWDDFGTPRDAAWGSPGVLAGPVWEAARTDPSSLELYPTSDELAAPILSPAMLAFAQSLGYDGPARTTEQAAAEARAADRQPPQATTTFYPEP